MFSILSWNILQGGGSRCAEILHQILLLKPTVCVLSEYRNNARGDKLRKGLLSGGYSYQFSTYSSENENSVLIVSLIPCIHEIHPTADPIFSGNILSIHFDIFSIMGVYLPHKKKHVLFDYILEHINNFKKHYIITGDFNTGKNLIDQNGQSFWYEDKLFALEKAGFVDAFRHIHGDTRQYSWYSHQGNGFRYDQSYMHHSLLPILKECHYIHEWRKAGLSDHSPMYLELG